MIAPASPILTTDPVVVFEIDDTAEPADVLEPLAHLLIDLYRKRKLAQAGARQEVAGR